MNLLLYATTQWPWVNHDPQPVHVVVAQTDARQTIVEMPQEQQAKQDREERLMDQAQANKN
jgi:two-component system nitrogen regulation sensor histidine kinase GlnL